MPPAATHCPKRPAVVTWTIGRWTEAGRRARLSGVIRNTVLHLANEQPLLVDLFEVPKPGDVTLICTNLRHPNGRRPVFVDRADSVFVFPYAQIRFVEVPAEELAGRELTPSDGVGRAGESEEGRDRTGRTVEADSEDVELDSALLERIREL